MKNRNNSPIVRIIVLVGFFFYGTDMAWTNISPLTSSIPNWTTAAVSVASAVILAVYAFLVMTTSVMGMVFYGGSLVRFCMSQPGTAQPARRK